MEEWPDGSFVSSPSQDQGPASSAKVLASRVGGEDLGWKGKTLTYSSKGQGTSSISRKKKRDGERGLGWVGKRIRGREAKKGNVPTTEMAKKAGATSFRRVLKKS